MPHKLKKKMFILLIFIKGYHYFFNYLSGIGGVKFLGVKIITVQVTFGDAASVVEWVNSFDHGLKAFKTKIMDYIIKLVLLPLNSWHFLPFLLQTMWIGSGEHGILHCKGMAFDLGRES